MKKIYQTQQRKELIAFLEKHNEKVFTIEEIIEYMKSEKASRKIQDIVWDELGFEVTEDRNIFFGKCKECLRAK